jgi:hypothetical protein
MTTWEGERMTMWEEMTMWEGKAGLDLGGEECGDRERGRDRIGRRWRSNPKVDAVKIASNMGHPTVD